MNQNLKNYWYVATTSTTLGRTKPLPVVILGQHLVLFRNAQGEAVALDDRCLHRSAPLSLGSVSNGVLKCSYHGWCYDSAGSVCGIPSDGPQKPRITIPTPPPYPCKEQDGLIFICFSQTPVYKRPFDSPYYGKPGYRTIRRINRFRNTLVNCAENYVDVPHTAYVHPTIFRNERGQELRIVVSRENGRVRTTFFDEKDNFGIFSWFVNPRREPVVHHDHFYSPNITSVEYHFGRGSFYITSQCTPVGDGETLVYTDLTYNYGWLTPFCGPFIRWAGQKVIDQDIDILDAQYRNLQRFPVDAGHRFHNSPADVVHVYIETLMREIEEGRDPRDLPPLQKDLTIWV